MKPQPMKAYDQCTIDIPAEPAPPEQPSTNTEAGEEDAAVHALASMEEGKLAGEMKEPVSRGEETAPESTAGKKPVAIEPHTVELTAEQKATTEAVLENGVIAPCPIAEPAPVRQSPPETAAKVNPSVVRLMEEGRLHLAGRKTISLAEARVHAFSRSIDDENLELEHPEALEGEEDDRLGAMQDFRSHLRSRTKTIAGAGRHVQVGRRTSKDLRREAMRNRMQKPSALPDLGRERRVELELLSPDMEAKIREMICNGIGAKYGGLRRATRAATTIQRAYRDYRLRETFREIRQEKKEMTMMGVKGGHRPSILRRKQTGESLQRRSGSTQRWTTHVGSPTNQRGADLSDSVEPPNKHVAEPSNQGGKDEEVFAKELSLSDIGELEIEESSLVSSAALLLEEELQQPRKRRNRPVSVFHTRNVQVPGGTIPRRRTVSAPAIAHRKMRIGINHFNRYPKLCMATARSYTLGRQLCCL